jgi:hypothetical protein
MILDKLNRELSGFDVKIEFNKTNPLYSDFILSHKGKIIGNGWKRANKNEVVGFIGYSLPALNGKLCWTKNRESITHEEFDDVINLFQFAISEDFYWFSPPTNRQNAGFSCKALTDSSKFIEYISQFIKNNYDQKIFLSESYKWDWPGGN